MKRLTIFILFVLLSSTACLAQSKSSPLDIPRATSIVEETHIVARTPVATRVLESPNRELRAKIICYQGYMQWDCVTEFNNGNRLLGVPNEEGWSLDGRYAMVCVGATHDSPCTGFQIWDITNGTAIQSIFPDHLRWWSPIEQHQLVYFVESQLEGITDKLIQFDPETRSTKYLAKCPDWLHSKFQELCDNFPGVWIGGQIDGFPPGSTVIVTTEMNVLRGNTTWATYLRKPNGSTYIVQPKAEGYISNPISYTIQISGAQALVVKDGFVTTVDTNHLDFHFEKLIPSNSPTTIPYPKP